MISQVYVNGNRCDVRFSSETPQSMVSALRRTLMLDLPENAVSNVTVHCNTSVYPCEMLAHRISMVPLNESCNIISLNATGPSTVYSDMIVCKETGKQVMPLGIMLFPLGDNQKVHFSGEVTRGTGRDHSRFVQCAGISMKKCSQSNISMEKECWCGANFIPKSQHSDSCSRCGYKKHSDNLESEYVLSYTCLNTKNHPVSYIMRAIDVVSKKVKIVKEAVC